MPGRKRRQSKRPSTTTSSNGMCLECTTTAVFVSLFPIEIFPPEALLLPHIRRQYEAILAAGNADLETRNVDWQRVVDNWSLPFALRHKPSKI